MIDFAQNILGKKFRDVITQDISKYFSEDKTESNTIEYKSLSENTNWEATINTVSKAICAFLNGSGGLLILGAPRGIKRDGSNEDVFSGSPTYSKNPKALDWLINKLSTEISPMPKDIQVNIMESNEGFIYLFNVAESTFKPHQYNHLYYIRLDGQSKPAPHYIVQALMREIKFPDIRGYIGFSVANVDNNRTLLEIRVGIFNFSQNQNEFDINYSILLVGARFHNPQLTSPVFSYGMNYARLYRRPMTEPLYHGMPITAAHKIISDVDAEEIEIMLTFGGKQSPAKNSRYTLSLQNLEIRNVSRNVIEAIENEPFKQLQTIDDAVNFFKENRI